MCSVCQAVVVNLVSIFSLLFSLSLNIFLFTTEHHYSSLSLGEGKKSCLLASLLSLAALFFFISKKGKRMQALKKYERIMFAGDNRPSK
jgi:hypothetical protein